MLIYSHVTKKLRLQDEEVKIVTEYVLWLNNVE